MNVDIERHAKRMVFLTKMSEVREWTNEQVIRLIDSYKEKAMLWDPNHDLYRYL